MPAFGGLVTTHVAGGLLNTGLYLQGRREVSRFSLMTLTKESYISRARDKIATFALEQGFDRLLFIDADMIWSPEWVSLLLDSTADVVGGTYPVKSFPIAMNLNPLPEHEEFFGGMKRGYDAYVNYVRTFADKRGEVPVRHIPTGFMMIRRSVLEFLAPSCERYVSWDASTQSPKEIISFFPGGTIQNGSLMTEDWAFCEKVREAGLALRLQTRAICGHTGTHDFRLGQFFGETTPRLDGPFAPGEDKESVEEEK